MNTTVRDEWTARELDDSTPIMEKALELKDRKEIRPRNVVRRINIILVILFLSLMGLVASLMTIRAGIYSTPNQQALAGFLVLSSLGIFAASVLGLVLTMWNAFVIAYMQALAWKFEAAEATDQVHIIVESVAAATATAAAVSAASKAIPPAFPVNEVLMYAVRKAVAKAGETETREMVTAFKVAAGE